MTDPNSERELKLAVAPDFRMPSLYGLAAGASERRAGPERLSTTYYDTPDLRLARWGASLRHRPGEGWTVKLPPESDHPVLVRPELTLPGAGGEPPPEAIDLVRAFTRDALLLPRTRLSTLRRRVVLHGADGRPLAEVLEDDVVVVAGNGSRSGFREVEVELGDEMPLELLDALVERLRLAGADAPDPTPKYIRSLGSETELQPEIPIPTLTPAATAGDVVRRAIAVSVVRLIRHDPVMRLDVDPEGVHQARVATRRLRSDLRTFRSLLEAGWATSLRDELSWLAGHLGAVRDGDVLLERLQRRVARLPASEQAGGGLVLATLDAARDDTHADLLAVLRSARYVGLLDRLVAAGSAPRLLDATDDPARDVLPALVRRPWSSLVERVGSLGSTPSDEQLHDIRIRTKRVRYAAEAATPVVDDKARRFARAAADLQSELGELNDAVVAESWLRNWSQGSSAAEDTRAVSEMIAAEQAAAERARARWRKAWEQLSSPKLRAWL